MNPDTRVRTSQGNTGTILMVYNEMAKVILDHHRSSATTPNKRYAEDMNRAAWYYLIELEKL